MASQMSYSFGMPFLLSYTSPTNKKTFLGLKSFMDVLLL
jgi:hypothetical protein